MRSVLLRTISFITTIAFSLLCATTNMEGIIQSKSAKAVDAEVILGDLDGDCIVNTFDMVLLRQIVGYDKPYDRAGDLDSNGRIDYFDLYLLNQFLLGVIKQFPGSTYDDIISHDRTVLGGAQTELSLTQEMADITESLAAPVNIYNYISNNINFEFYPDSRKGAIGTFEQYGGNDYDIASLFIAMLEHLNYEASYINGTIELTEQQAINYTGAKDIDSALNIIRLRDPEATYNQQLNTISFNHVWVKLIYDSNEFYLDPSFKEYMSVDSIFDEYDSNLDDWVADADYFKYSMKENYKSESNVKSGYLTNRKIKLIEYNALPTGLPYEATIETEFDNVASDDSDKISFYFGGEFHEFRSAELYNKRITIEFAVNEDENEGYDIYPNNVYGLINSGWSNYVKLHPILKIDGEEYFEGNGAEVGSYQTTAVKLHTNSQDYIFTKDMCVGSIYSIVFDYQNIAAYKTSTSINDVYSLNDSISKSNLYSDEYMGKILDLVGYNYFTQLDIATRTISEETNTYYSHNLSVAFFGYEPEITEKTSMGVSMGHRIQQSGDFVIDVIGNTYSCTAKDSNNNNELIFKSSSGMMSSYMESNVLKELFDVDSVSTMEVIKYAENNDIDIYTLYSGSEHDLSELNVNSNANIIIGKALDAGYIVTVPQRDITINSWTGSGYIMYDPNSGYSIYMLSRNVGTSGGATTTGISFDQIIAMVAASLDLAISAAVFYNLVNAFTMASILTPVPGLGLMMFATFCFVTAVFNYVYTLAIVNEAYNGDEACQKYLQDERAWYLLDIGLIASCAALTKYGGTIYNYFKNQIVVSELSSEVARDSLNYVDDAYDVVHSSERMLNSGLARETVSQAVEYGDDYVHGLESITKQNPEIIEILNSASDKDKAVYHLLEFGDDAVADYMEVGSDGIDMLLDNISKMPDDMTNVWGLRSTVRGKYIERAAAATEYKTWFYIGDECNGYYPVIDFQKDTTIVSFKTMNPSSYSETARISKIDEYAEALGSFVQYHGDDLCNNKILDIRIPPGTSNMIDTETIKSIAEENGIQIKIGEFE